MPVFVILAGYTFKPKPWRELLSQSGDLCDPCGRLVYYLADHASAYDTAGIVALRIDCALCLRYWIGVRD